MACRSPLRLVLAFALAGCAPAPTGGFAAPSPTPAPETVDPPPWWGWATDPITSLSEDSALGEAPGCVAALEGCSEDYERFPELAAQEARPRDDEALATALQQTWSGAAPAEAPTAPVALGAALGDALNIGFLLGGIGARPLEVRTIQRLEAAEHDELELLFIDPWVGTFRGRLWLPLAMDWATPILGIHGHGTEAVDVFDFYSGAELVAAGHPVLALDLRVNAADDLEDAVQRRLLGSGFSLLEIRIYEAALGLKYLRGRGDMPPEVGLLAHSGGAAAMNVAIRLNSGVAAYAYDHTSDYNCRLDGVRLLDDSVPEVWPYRALINDLSTVVLPTYAAAYGFPEGPEPLLAFF